MDKFSGDIDTTTDNPITGTVSEFTKAIYSTICGDDDGCYRRAAQRVVTTSAPTMLPGFSTTIPTHRTECTEEEIDVAACQNGGQCFAIKLGEIRRPACSCTAERTGSRCEFRFIDPSIFESRDREIRTAHMAAGISVFILIVFALLVALYVWHRYNRKKRLLKDREFEATAEELYRRPFSARSSIVESMSRPSSVRRGIPLGDGPVLCEYPAPTAALNSTDGVGSLNGISTSASVSAYHHPEETIRLNVIHDHDGDHNKQLGHSDAS